MRCYHCTETVTDLNRWQVDFDGALRQVCCAGCKAVMQAIVDARLGDYYRFRTEPAQFGVIPDNLSAQLDQLAVFDEPEVIERYLHPAEADGLPDLVEVNLAVEGLRCGACVWVLERSVSAMPGVESARVNFSSARATVRFDSHRLKLSGILGRIAQVGYKTVPFDVHERELSLKHQSRAFLQRLFIAGIATMQVMMYALPAYVAEAGEIAKEHKQLLRWASLVLTTPVLLYSAQPFLSGAIRDLKHRQPGMDVPVSIGILAAFSASVWSTVTASGEIYFDSVAMFVFLLLGARYLEWTVRRRAMRAVDDISASAPETAQLLVNGELTTVPAVRLEVGDVVVVDNGNRVPVDGVVSQGLSAINNALVTGESVPVCVAPGDEIAGGALLSGAPIQMRVIRRQSASTLSVIDRLIERGAVEKPQAVLLADKVAKVFVSALLVFAAVVWIVWLLVDASKAAPTAIAVLVVSCPCALSLATPAALAAATGDLLKRRLLITRGHALETLSKVTDVVFDKTGTLTNGKPELIAMQCQPEESDKLLKLAVAMETGSSHPYAYALRKALHKIDDVSASAETAGSQDCVQALTLLGYAVSGVHHEAGLGISARLDNNELICLGSAAWCGLDEDETDRWRESDDANALAASEIFLSIRPASEHSQDVSDNDRFDASAEASALTGKSVRVLARMLLMDVIRDDAKQLVGHLQTSGLVVHLLSGDREPAVKVAAGKLNLMHWVAGASPQSKQTYVKGLQDQHKVVLMVGDGINDAPVLASSDVSMAAGEASALARTAADVISLLPGLEGIPVLLRKATKTSKIIRQNLVWAAGYNVIAIPLAAMGWVPPWAAALGMAASSLLVAANAQRLWSARATQATQH